MTFIAYALVIIVVSMFGALIPHIYKLSDSQIHSLIALSTGIFIGLLFMILLPETLEELQNSGYCVYQSMYPILIGFLLIMVIEVIIKYKHMSKCSCQCSKDTHSHDITSISSFIGLSIHAACDGMALATTFLAGEDICLVTTIAMCIHKVIVLFSLSSTVLLTDINRRRATLYLFLFSCVTPVFGIVFFIMFNGIYPEYIMGVPLAFASGTFMYVTLCDMFPEAFHRKSQNLTSSILMIIGVSVIVVLNIAFPHLH